MSIPISFLCLLDRQLVCYYSDLSTQVNENIHQFLSRQSRFCRSTRCRLLYFTGLWLFCQKSKTFSIQNMFHIIFPHWIFGEVVCKLYVLVLHMVPCAVIGILVCVSLEKYIAVLHPLLALKLLTPKLRVIMVSVIWITSLGINFPYYFTTKQLGENVKYCSRVDHGLISTSTMITVSFVFWYCIPLLIMIFLYSRIGIVLWKSSLSPLEVRYSNGKRELYWYNNLN
jgi:hypothetical protein